MGNQALTSKHLHGSNKMIIVTAQRRSFLKAPFCGELEWTVDLANRGREAAFLNFSSVEWIGLMEGL